MDKYIMVRGGGLLKPIYDLIPEHCSHQIDSEIWSILCYYHIVTQCPCSVLKIPQLVLSIGKVIHHNGTLESSPVCSEIVCFAPSCAIIAQLQQLPCPVQHERKKTNVKQMTVYLGVRNYLVISTLSIMHVMVKHDIMIQGQFRPHTIN